MSYGQKKNFTGTISFHWPVPKIHIIKRSPVFPHRPGHSLSVLLKSVFQTTAINGLEFAFKIDPICHSNYS